MNLLFALILDWFFGDPASIWKRAPHPVVLIGNAIDFLDQKFNDPTLDDASNRGRGILALFILFGLAIFLGVALTWAFAQLGFIGWLLETIIIAIFIAQKSLADHVGNVASAMRLEGIEGGRAAVSQIVGRNTEVLDQPGICRAAIESLAENFSDGVVAPVFWYVILGLPGLIAYKVINTADSMIGHKNARYENFGRATALLDDLVNWPAARFSAGLISIAAMLHQGIKRGAVVLNQTLLDAGTHRSPNAGWPETAMAASLDISLGGPRIYAGETVLEPVLNASAKRVVLVHDIDAALKIYQTACFLLWGAIAVISLIMR